MGKYLKEFCDQQRKPVDGHVRDVIDMEERDKDQAVMAFLRDDDKSEAAWLYPTMSNSGKNYTYANLEQKIQDCINDYNYGVDLDKDLAGDSPLTNGERAFV